MDQPAPGGPSREPGSWHCARGIGATGVVSSSLELGVRLPTTSLCPIQWLQVVPAVAVVIYHLTQFLAFYPSHSVPEDYWPAVRHN